MASEAALLARLKALEDKLAEAGKADQARTPNVLTLDEKAQFALAGVSPRNRAAIQHYSEYPKVLYSVWRPDGVEVKDEFHEGELRQEHGPWLSPRRVCRQRSSTSFTRIRAVIG